MSKVTKEGVVEIPAPTQNLPSNPLLGYSRADTATASRSGSSKTSFSLGILRNRVLLRDQRCFVTGAASTQLEACHLINTIRKKDPDNLSVKAAVESVLTRQQFSTGVFGLDNLPNCVALRADLHTALDSYGLFCVTIPIQQILSIISKLVQSNEDWEKRAESDSEAKRNLNLSEDPFVVKECVLLVLRPEPFLPEGQPIQIASKRPLRTPGGPNLADTDKPSWVSYYCQKDKALLATKTGEEFSSFQCKSSLRGPGDALSAFSLLVNANSKLQAIKGKPYTSDLENYIRSVELAVKNIFFVPKALQKLPLPEVPSDAPTPTRQSPSIATPGPSGSGTVEKGESDPDVEFEGSDYSEDEDELEEDEDEDPNLINGLTFPEMQTVLQRVSDGSLSAEERGEAAMLMLGMAGGPKRPQGVSPLIEDYF